MCKIIGGYIKRITEPKHHQISYMTNSVEAIRKITKKQQHKAATLVKHFFTLHTISLYRRNKASYIIFLYQNKTHLVEKKRQSSYIDFIVANLE